MIIFHLMKTLVHLWYFQPPHRWDTEHIIFFHTLITFIKPPNFCTNKINQLPHTVHIYYIIFQQSSASAPLCTILHVDATTSSIVITFLIHSLFLIPHFITIILLCSIVDVQSGKRSSYRKNQSQKKVV